MSPYESARAERDRLSSVMIHHSHALKAFPKSGPLGLTPDAVKFSAEFRAVKREYDIAFDRLRGFNVLFVKRFAREIREERNARYGG